MKQPALTQCQTIIQSNCINESKWINLSNYVFSKKNSLLMKMKLVLYNDQITLFKMADDLSFHSISSVKTIWISILHYHYGLTHWRQDIRLSFRRWHFQVHSLEWRFQILNKFSLKYVSKLLIVSTITLVPNRQQAIIWTNECMFYWCSNASLSLNELNFQGCIDTDTASL